MSFQNNMFRPGPILHEVIVGALRAKGSSLQEWVKSRGMSATAVRNVTFGQSAGPRSQALLYQLIKDAGREVVAVSYRIRMEAEAARIAKLAEAA